MSIMKIKIFFSEWRAQFINTYVCVCVYIYIVYLCVCVYVCESYCGLIKSNNSQATIIL